MEPQGIKHKLIHLIYHGYCYIYMLMHVQINVKYGYAFFLKCIYEIGMLVLLDKQVLSRLGYGNNACLIFKKYNHAAQATNNTKLCKLKKERLKVNARMEKKPSEDLD